MQNNAAFYGCIAAANPGIDPAQLDRVLALRDWEAMATDDRATDEDNVEREDGVQKTIVWETAIDTLESEQDAVIEALQDTAEWFGLGVRVERGWANPRVRRLYVTVLRIDGKIVSDVQDGDDGKPYRSADYLESKRDTSLYDIWQRAQVVVRRAVLS